MSWIDLFRTNQKPTANVARERLQVIVAHQRGLRNSPDYLPALQADILAVLRKYVEVGDEDVSVEMEHGSDCEVLALNISLPS